MALPEWLYSKRIDVRGAVSSEPCIIISEKSGLFLGKGWKWYRKMDFVKNWQDARVFQNSAGAKNAVMAAVGTDNIDNIFVIELGTAIKLENEVKEWRKDLKLKAAKEFNRMFKVM